MNPTSNLNSSVTRTERKRPPAGLLSRLLASLWPILDRVARIARLLLIGYPSKDAQQEHEANRDWEKLHATLLRKVENIGIVSGLLLASNANLLISSSGDLRRMTYTTVAASILAALISLIFDFLCLWALMGVHPSRLKYLTQRSMLFYYMCGTPSLFGGGSALAFFTAVGSWVWQDQVNQDRNYIAKVCVVVLGGVLALNSCVCFYLGGSMKGEDWVRAQDREDRGIPQGVQTLELSRRGSHQSQVSDVIVLDRLPRSDSASEAV